MGYANIQADSNFYRQSLNADGVKYVTGPYTSLYEDVFRAVTVTTDSVVSVTSYVGDSLSNQFLLAGTEIYGLFSSVTIHSGKAVLHLAGASYISEIINQYSATGIPLGFYEEGTQCLSQKISALLTQGLFDDASWVMVPSQYEEDWVRAFKPTSELGNLAFTRSSDATFTDSTGVVRRSPWNLVTYSEMFTDASWTKGEITISPNVAIAPNGTLTADKAIPSTTPTTHQILSGTLLSSAQCAYSVYAKADGYNTISILDRATASNGATFNVLNGTVQQILGTATASIVPVGNGWYRCIVVANTTGIRIYVPTSASNFAGDGTSGVLLWGAQLVEGSEALPYFATTDRLNVPRLDYRNADGTLSTCPRLLLEPQRTNSIRNSSMVGAVAGSPGTLPTNWLNLVTAGLTTSIAGVGIENGLPYVDIRFNGTANATSIRVDFDGATAIAALNAQVWTQSIYAKIISAPNPALSYVLQMLERTSAGGYVTEGTQFFTPTTSLQRFAFTRTLNGGATVANVQPCITINLTNGAAYDFTIRIAAPQMERGAYATTWIPTTTTSVTRVVDAFTRNNIFTNGFISNAGGTWFVDLANVISYTRDSTTGISLGDSASQNTGNQFIIRSPSTGRVNILVLVGGVSVALYTLPADSCKIAIKWNGTSVEAFVNGVKRINATSFTTTVMQNIAFDAGVPFSINQSLLIPYPLTDSECIALTTL